MSHNQVGYHKSIDDFKKSIKGGLSSPTRYHVQIHVGKKGTEEEGGMGLPDFLPESITLPARGFSFYTDAQYGAIRQYPYRRQFNTEIVMTIAVHEDQRQREFFEWWMNELIDTNERVSPSFTKTNIATMTISCLDHFDKPRGKYKIYGAYPSSIIPANYGYGMMNEYAKMQITFNYRKYEFETM